MARDYGDGTYGSGTYGGGSPDASITTTTVARSVVVRTPHLGQFVAGDDVLYLVASHDPSILVVARRGIMKRVSHTPALVSKAGHTPAIRKIASVNRPIS